MATADLEKSGAGAVEADEPVKIDRKTADWQKAQKVMEDGTIHRGRVDACNSGGLLVRFGSLQGFLPFSQMDSGRIPKDGSKALAEIAKELVGDLVSVKMIEVNESERRLIFSERQAVLEENLRLVEEGSVYNGKVNSVTDFGAFVDLALPDGTSSVSGLVHISELSWDPVRNPRDLLEEGQMVRVKVIQLDKERKRLALSIKQLETDPLLETLDTLMPVQTQVASEPIEQDAELIGTSLPGLEQICEELLNEEGITGVTLGRTRLEKRVVSQDLELWLANAPVEGGKFSLLARAGRQVQEVQLNTSLDREGIKEAVQRVIGRVP
jgi:predicted RNA-binding protein with RPS1 domain